MLYKRDNDITLYCDSCHSFIGSRDNVSYPLVVNWLITDYCNFRCRYCFATDIDNIEMPDPRVIAWINSSKFLKVVISGGEPFTNKNIWMILGSVSTNNKSIVVDTNGSYEFTNDEMEFLRNRNITLRISVDCASPKDNDSIRIPSQNSSYANILSNIESLKRVGNVDIEIQTVVTKKNIKSLEKLSEIIKYLGISKWYLQPLIPSGRAENMHNLIPTVNSIANEGKKFPINNKKYIIKEDKGNRAVILLTNNGKLITEDSNGNNIIIGEVINSSPTNLFEYIDKESHLNRYKLSNYCSCSSQSSLF